MKTQYYNCFSYNQMKHLVEGGAKAIDVKMHHTTKKTFWVFVRDELLDELLGTYGK